MERDTVSSRGVLDLQMGQSRSLLTMVNLIFQANDVELGERFIISYHRQ
jgi:hypothetical protein